MSNAASFQSIPETKGTSSQTVINSLPIGMSATDVDNFLERKWNGIYPVVPLIHGFCFCLKRDVIDVIGTFDEEAFPHGYGEENDFCFRASDAGFDLAVATNTYVFHAKSKSYSDEERARYMAEGTEAIIRKHSRHRLKSAVAFMEGNPILWTIRDQASSLFMR